MSFKKLEIEAIIDSTLEDVLTELFSNEVDKIESIQYALDYLKTKVEALEAEDFEDCLES
jgi:hypothetical protein